VNILLVRRWRGTNSTVSTVSVDGKAHQFILEDRDRGLKASMDLADIIRQKVYGKTAIPAGRYQVVITHSARFKRLLPLLIGVPGYEGIRIHPGNRHVNTDGCLLPGKVYFQENDDFVVGSSRTASEDLQLKIASAIQRGEKVWIEIKTEYK